jgi:hypothetical protein
MYNILEKDELEKLKNDEPHRFQFVPQGFFYLNLRGLKLKPMEGIDTEIISDLAKIVRGFAFAAIEGIKSGHPGGSSSKVEQVLALLQAEF